MRILNISLLYLLSFGFLFSCEQTGRTNKPETIDIPDITIHDYGRALFSLDPMNVKEGLDSLSGTYSFFTGTEIDTLASLQIRDFIVDPFNRELAQKYFEVYPDPGWLEEDLTGLFRAIKSTDTGLVVPEVYTYVSGLLYESPVTYFDSVLIIGLDMFLGWDYESYRAAGIPVYLSKRMEPQNIVPECARQVAMSMLPDDMELKTLLDVMIYHGKVLYAMDIFLPETKDSLKIGYTGEQMSWADDNESSIWRLFIDREMLYKTDAFQINRFIQDGPFTAGLPEGAPAMLGRYIGWQIVRSYMKKNSSASLQELMNQADSQLILSKSGYKPRR